ncbi:MAG TPA: DUF2277 domain-containing protein [Patescibacteria group bacterium]|nr:DUF2277 domain-containing protein [Patescibacteria group bacterium]
MCRNIKPLFNFEPHATNDEVSAAALQYVRKVSGYNKPSDANRQAFDEAVAEIAHATEHLLHHLSMTAEPKNREKEAAKAHERAIKRFGNLSSRT